MDKKAEFKAFARSHPELLKNINAGNATWQKYYEIYDIYGPSESAWEPYLHTERSSKFDFNTLGNIIKKVDINNIEKHINNAQKALGFIESFTAGKAADVAKNTKTVVKKPNNLNNFFED